MKITKVVQVDAPCPLCQSSETAGPYECKRCGLDVCVECFELTGIGCDKHRKRVLCKPCVSAVEAELALESLAGPSQKEEDELAKAKRELRELQRAFIAKQQPIPYSPPQWNDMPTRGKDWPGDDSFYKSYDNAKT